jgi:NADPH-dependent curcumin reductase CurA
MRGRMSDAPSYSAHVEIGQTMVGHTVSQVIESKNPAFAASDFVAELRRLAGLRPVGRPELRKLDPSSAPLQAAGLLGMPGMTAYVRLLDIGQPKKERRRRRRRRCGGPWSGSCEDQGCRAVGIAGSPEKCSA